MQESEEKRERFEQKMSVDEKEMKNKFISYENNLEQLTLMYH